MPVFKDLRGQQFHLLTAVEYLGQSPKGSMWRFRCDCGNLVDRSYSNVVQAKKGNGTKSCGCLKKSKDAARRQIPEMRMWGEYRSNARFKNRVLSLTLSEFLALVRQPCVYCGSPPLSGLDRVDSEIGYTSINSVPCCKICNRAKREMPLTEFQAWIARLIQHHTV